MRHAMRGWNRLREYAYTDPLEAVRGWEEIASAAERAHRVFSAEMTNTSTESYPRIRLPLSGVRGADGTVYPEHEVFYEACGTELLLDSFSNYGTGCYVVCEFGQTGANNSMSKCLDVFNCVFSARSAYKLTIERNSWFTL